ncbi:MAG: diaminopimelate decarboxylase [Ruminococcaceae bacterium]|nr:diaminopimelate decarboxylase [Oscillospiraceae bacterium]
MLHDNLSINEAGHLTLGGVDTVKMAEKYGTPLYLLDEDRVRENCRTYLTAMKEYFGGGSGPLLASKALSFKGIYRIAKEEGMRTDLVSLGEMFTAHAAGFPLDRAYFHGNNKTDRDIETAMEYGVGTFAVDNREELYAIEEIAARRGIRQNILLRLSPGIDPHTQEKISTGKVDSKFGTAIETGQAEELTKEALSLPHVSLLGFHCHVGSQIFEETPFTDAADIMLAFMACMRDKYGFTASVLNLGGGFGVRYTESDPVIDYRANIRLVAEHVKARCAEYDFPMPEVLMEPGRSIVADAGVTLYTVGSVKTITGYKSYVSVDGGMPDNPRYALYASRYTVELASNMHAPRDFVATVAGRCCESGDLIGEDMTMARPSRGDILAVLVTGAYNFSMASNYNRIPRAPLVLLSEGTDRIGVAGESYEDLYRLDV